MRSILTGIARYAALLCLGAGSLARADETREPLWELGAGVGALSFPSWIGSRQHDDYLVPVPYVIYRGERIQADRGGIRGIVFESGALSLRLSLAASPPPHDRDDAAREDMPGLDPVFELGPELRLRVWEDRAAHAELNLRLPVRAAIAASSEGLDSVGWFANPSLNLELREWPAPGWKLGLNAGPVFGDEDYHAYYYEVAPRYATTTRPAYEADAGYGGFAFVGSLSRRRGNWWLGAFLRAQTLSGAEFEDSPLVRTDSALSAGVAVAWVFARSQRMVQVKSED